MSGNAALAAARRRRSAQPVQPPSKPGSVNRTDNQYLNQLNSIADEFTNTNPVLPEKISISSIVINHEKRINLLKKELDELKLDSSTLSLASDNKTLDKAVTFSNPPQDSRIEDLTSKIDILENNFKTIDTTVKTYESKIKTIDGELNAYKKDIENFKVIFLNINKIVNDLKSISDNNSIDINNIKTFLNDNTFVEKTTESSLSTIPEESKTDSSTPESLEASSENKIEMEIVSK